MRLTALDLRPDANFPDVEITCPGFDYLAKAPANSVSAKTVFDDQSSYNDCIFRLKMTLYRGVDPTCNYTIHFGDEDCPVREKRSAFDPRSHFGCIARIAQLGAQLRSCFCIFGGDSSYPECIHVRYIMTEFRV